MIAKEMKHFISVELNLMNFEQNCNFCEAG